MKENLKIIYTSVTIIFAISLFLGYNDWNFYGYYTEKIIAWIWIVCTILFIITYRKNKKVRLYFYSLIILLFLSIIPMAIPFFGIVNYISDNGDYERIKLNENYRIERTRNHPLSLPRIYIYERRFGIIEKNIARPLYSEILEKISGENNPQDIPLQNAKLININNDSIGIEYQINNIKKVIHHPVKDNDDAY
ncbi:hypothetical protein HZP15_12445 [Elizabethkingia anophelis]|nr:hypothetical protein [Elizabethkingia anophelis]